MNNATELKKRNAVIYCRVSDKVQVFGSSLAFQEQACKEYARQNNYEIVQTFIEKGQSARTDDRTELLKLTSFCKQKANGVKAVIFHKVDRWARQSLDYQLLKKELKDRNIAVVSATEPLEDTPAGRFMENVLASQAQFDNEVRIERCKNGMRDAVKEGRFVWTAPIGYSNGRNGKNTNIVPNEKAGIIRRAFEEVARNPVSIELIRLNLVKEGLTNGKGNPMPRQHFYRILRNEIYCGWITVFGERNKGTFEPIISEELFQQVQRVLNRSKIPKLIYKKDREEFPLRRFIRQRSGYALSGHLTKGRNKRYAHYYLRNPVRTYPAADIEAAFKQLLNNFELSDKYLATLRSKVKTKLTEKNVENKEARQKAERHVQALKQKQNALIQKNIDGVISDEILKSQLDHIEEELINANAILFTSQTDNVRFDLLLDTVNEYLKNPAEIWTKAPLTTKLKLQWFTFPKGLLFDGEKLETAEICNLFKAKNDNFDELSRVVYHSSRKVNHIKNEPYFSKGDLPTKASPKNEAANESVYWNNIGQELIELSRILTDQ